MLFISEYTKIIIVYRRNISMNKIKHIITWITIITSVIVLSSMTLSCQQLLDSIPEDVKEQVTKELFNLFSEGSGTIDQLVSDADDYQSDADDYQYEPPIDEQAQIDNQKLYQKGASIITLNTHVEAFALFLRTLAAVPLYASNNSGNVYNHGPTKISALTTGPFNTQVQNVLTYYESQFRELTGKPTPTKIPIWFKKYVDIDTARSYTVTYKNFETKKDTLKISTTGERIMTGTLTIAKGTDEVYTKDIRIEVKYANGTLEKMDFYYNDGINNKHPKDITSKDIALKYLYQRKSASKRILKTHISIPSASENTK